MVAEIKLLKEGELEIWTPPGEVLSTIDAAFGSTFTAAEFIVSQLADGMARSGAAKTVISYGGFERSRADSVAVPARHWQLLRGHAHGQTFWKTASVEFWERGGNERIVYYGLRIDLDGLKALMPPSVPISDAAPVPGGATPSLPKHLGGAPRKEFWDDLLIAIFKKIWDGDLQPANQEAVAKAMLEWAEMRRFKLSETSVKAPAKKLFNAYKSGVKN